MSLREGVWLALLGSLAMIAGAVWPVGRAAADGGVREKDLQDAWSGLSGWTPES